MLFRSELIKKIKILNTPLQIDRERDIAVLNITELSDNEKTDRHNKLLNKLVN